MSQVNIAACGINEEGLSIVPTLTIIEFGRAGLSVPIAVPQFSQKCRVTASLISFRVKVLAFPET